MASNINDRLPTDPCGKPHISLLARWQSPPDTLLLLISLVFLYFCGLDQLRWDTERKCERLL